MKSDLAPERKIARAAMREEMRARTIAEIRRIAAENGGAPPGIRQFMRRSGIARSAVLGKIWLPLERGVAGRGFSSE